MYVHYDFRMCMFLLQQYIYKRLKKVQGRLSKYHPIHEIQTDELELMCSSQ